ncbi:MAG: nucleotide pyrophosphohydrolase [Phycisphaera sp.]|nr:MAG: nucleotide pyrophosphohydrolase [Phycisphaera sp.]
MTDKHSVTVAQIQQLIRDRYFESDNDRGSGGTFLYFMEEVGELATAIANNNRRRSPPTDEERENMVEEFADVIAWLCTLANINGVDLSEALAKYTDSSRVEGVKD